jgi:two-component system response regulator YesN
MNPKVRVLVAFMKSNLHRELTLDELSAMVGLSHSRLHSLFKAELRMAPIRYHRTLRLEGARMLLESTFWKVERIRIEIGYSDHKHFFQAFKAQFGVTPSQYRSRHIDATLSRKRVADKKIVKSATKK